VIAVVLFLLGKFLEVHVLHHIKLAAHNGFDTGLIGFVHKLEGPKHIAVVGNGAGQLTVGGRLFEHIADVGRSVKERKLCVAVEVRELRHGESSTFRVQR